MRYDPTMVADFRAKMSKFVCCVLDNIVKEFRKTMFIKEMNHSKLMDMLSRLRRRGSKRRIRRIKRPKLVASTSHNKV